MRSTHKAWHCAAATLLGLAACSQAVDTPPDRPAAAATTSLATATSPPATDDACRLLSDADIRAVFPGAGKGVRETTREKYGIRACVWETKGGRFALQRWTAKPGTVGDEIRGMALGVLDPLKPAARTSFRYETMAGIGDQAMAMVEAQNESRGILADAALLMTQRGEQLIELQSSELGRGDRAAALQSLATLARAAVARL